MQTNPTSSKPINLQDNFLNHVRKQGITINIYLVNGFMLKGKVSGFDNFTVILESEGKQQLIYKHAISTIALLSGDKIPLDGR